MTYAWHEIVGTVGVVLIVATYISLQLDRVGSDQLIYSVLNAAGAFMILISLFYSFNLPAFVVELFWLLISIFGVIKYLARNRGKAAG